MYNRVRHMSIRWTLALILVCASLLWIGTISLTSFGFYHDAGIYVTLAKSLARGEGYRLISLPGEPVDIKSPPAYPFLLSIIWRANSHFPQNLAAMAMLSVLAGLATLTLTFLYLT